VHAHRGPLALPNFRFCGLHNMASRIKLWREFTFKQTGLMCTWCFQFTSEFPVLRFAQYGLQNRNLKGCRIHSGWPTVHILRHSLPGFRFCGFAQYGIHMRNLNRVHLQTWWPNVHILPHSLPSFRFCGLHNMASTFEIWKEFTFTNQRSSTLN
jgi:hypothetical protein